MSAMTMKTARFWHRQNERLVQCDLCPHHCSIAEGKTGRCRVRLADDGELKAWGYGLLSAVHLDPIEKKPLYHFLPGSAIFSIGGWGCNLNCTFCQNWTISQQVEPHSRQFKPEEVLDQASSTASVGIAYTYNEPLIGYEFVYDCARLCKSKGLANVLVTNGYIQPEPAAELLPLVDALNIDIKSFDDAFYRQHCQATLPPVLAFCRQAARAGCHVEITNLIIPGLNDDEKLLGELARWIRDELGAGVALHLSGYHPEYKMRIPPTPPSTLERAYSICRQHLPYVYVGNVRTPSGQDTLCPGCGDLLIQRQGYATQVRGIGADGSCRKCGRRADIVRETTRSSG